MSIAKTLNGAIFFSFLAFYPANAQDVANTPQPLQNSNTIIERFDSGDLTTVLGGQLRQGQNASAWYVHLSNGKLMMENRKEPHSLHYQDISWVKYPNSSVVGTTRGAVISAVVEGTPATPGGGAGILNGSGKVGTYLAFVVDNAGFYHLFKKDGRALRLVISEPNAAIRIGQPNELSFETRGAIIAFLANGQDVIQIESPNRMPGNRRLDGRTGVGLAAFGIGKYSFDDVAISKAN